MLQDLEVVLVEDSDSMTNAWKACLDSHVFFVETPDLHVEEKFHGCGSHTAGEG